MIRYLTIIAIFKERQENQGVTAITQSYTIYLCMI